MRLILCGFLLCSLLLSGCESPRTMAAIDPSEEVVEDIDSPAPEPVDDPLPPSGPVLPSSTPGPEGFLTPDPLAEEPSGEIQGLKSSGQPVAWIFHYGGDWLPFSKTEKTKLQTWANGKGLTCSEVSAGNSSYATVRMVDITRDKVSRDLRFGQEKALYPVTLVVNQSGQTLLHIVGAVDYSFFDWWWDTIHQRKPKQSAVPIGGLMSVPEDEFPVDPEEKSLWDCGPNGCKPIGRKRK